MSLAPQKSKNSFPPHLIKYSYCLTVGLLIVTSFLLFAPVFYARFSSDSAIHVLMAHYFKFPDDLYFWGQDRLGSLVPMVASLPVKWFGASAIWSISIVHYLFLTAGFWLISTFIGRTLPKLLLCVLWFFPLQAFDFHLQISHPYAPQLFLLGLSLFLWNKIRKPGISLRRHNALLFFSTLSFMLSVWISDLGLFILPLFLIVLFRAYIRTSLKEEEITVQIDKKRLSAGLWPFLAALISGYLFLSFAKSHAEMHPISYDTIFSPVSHIQSGFSTVVDSIKRTFLFTVRNVLISFHSVFIALLLLLFGYAAWKRAYNPASRTLWLFFFGASVLTFLAVTASYWVELNDYHSRYYTFSYFLLLITLCLGTDRLRSGILYRMAAGLLLCVTLSASVNALIQRNEKYHPLVNLSATEIKEISLELGNCGLLGDYWMSYNLAAVYPDRIKAITWDTEAPRGRRMVSSVMQQDTLYLVGNHWLDSFADNRIEHGYFLARAGDPFTLRGLQLCRYKVIDSLELPLSWFQLRHSQLSTIPELNGQEALIKNDSVKPVNDFLFFGPFIGLRKGQYRVNFETGLLDADDTETFLSIDVVNNYGAQVLGKKEFTLAPGQHLRKKAAFTFLLKDTYTGPLEIRLFLKGKARAYLKNISIKRL